MGHKAGIGAIFGIVTEEGVVKPDSPVVLLDRENKKIVRRQNTDVNGGFTFNGLNEQEATYMVFATDEDGEEPKNALIQDRILPVPAYSGATFWGNWQFLARRDGANACWAGEYAVRDGNVFPYDALAMQSHGTNPAPSQRIGVGSITISETEPSIGAPHVPMLRFTGAAVSMAAGIPLFHGNFHNIPAEDRRSPRAHSAEYILNLASVSGVISLGLRPSGGFGTPFTTWWGSEPNANHRTGPYSRLDFDASTRTLSVYYRHGNVTYVSNNANWMSGVGAGTIATKSYQFDIGAVPTGLVHVAYTLDPGAFLKLFINGVKVQEWDLIAESPYLPYHSNPTNYSMGWGSSSLVFAGNPNGIYPTPITEADIGAAAVYIKTLLSEATIAEHYAAILTDTTLPKVTGYVKEVVMDQPAFYARLDDLQVDVEGNEFRQDEFMRKGYFDAWPSEFKSDTYWGRFTQIGTESIALEQVSPVVGGMSALFSGGYLNSVGVFAASGRDTEYTIEFFIAPSVTPGSAEQVVRMVRGTTPHIWVDLNASRQLTLGHRLDTGTNETVLFTTVLPDTVFSFVAIVVDKVALTATLYLDGVPVETVAINGAVLIKSVVSHLGETTGLHAYIAGSASGVTTFKGKLCEVAFYSRALPASRVLAHYNARLIP